MKYRLSFLTSHPIQYQVPLFRKLSIHPDIDLTVYFCSDLGVANKIDPGFGVPVQWDVPLLEGYRYQFLKNVSPVRIPTDFMSFVNPSIISMIGKRKPDAILVHGYASFTNWLGFFTAWMNGVPILLHGETIIHEAHGMVFSQFKRMLLSQLFRRVAAFLYVGTNSREFYQSFAIEAQKLFFSPYSVDNEFFEKGRSTWGPRRVEIRKQLGIPEDEVVVLFAGKLIARKRPFDCLKVFEQADVKASLVFVGDGDLMSELLRYVDAHNIPRVHFLGFKNQSEIVMYYSIADIFLFPSEFEPWGLVVNEAMCFGLPILTTAGVSAARDLVREGENGFVRPVGDIDGLARALNQLISSKEKRRCFGVRSSQIISEWNYQRCVEGIVQAVHYAVGRNHDDSI